MRLRGTVAAAKMYLTFRLYTLKYRFARYLFVISAAVQNHLRTAVTSMHVKSYSLNATGNSLNIFYYLLHLQLLSCCYFHSHLFITKAHQILLKTSHDHLCRYFPPLWMCLFHKLQRGGANLNSVIFSVTIPLPANESPLNQKLQNLKPNKNKILYSCDYI